jgi:hypothetical protein
MDLSCCKESNRQEKTMKAIGSTALRAGLPASILALACVSTAGSAVAQSRYDGSWSVAISTHRGECQSGLRYGLQILNGHVVSAAGGAAYVRGIVSPGGAVRVSVQSGGQWANGSGHLGVATGGGVWRGQGNAGSCSGTWSARRMTSQVATDQMPQVADQMPGRPIYNYVPAYAPNYARPTRRMRRVIISLRRPALLSTTMRHRRSGIEP